jgi:GTP-binding protein
MNRAFDHYGPYRGATTGRRRGVLISNSDGEAVAYALWNLEERGRMFVSPNEKVYRGMIIGEHTRENDLEVNPIKAKQQSNVRASGKDEAIRLTPISAMSLEQTLSYIEDDELVEVTPQSIRIRKRFLDPNDRKRAEKTK